MLKSGSHEVVERCEHCGHPLVYHENEALVLKARVVKVSTDQSRVTALCKYCKHETRVSIVQRTHENGHDDLKMNDV